MNAVTKDQETSSSVAPFNPFGSSVVAKPTGALQEAVSQREIAAVQARVVMAKRFPRDPVIAMDRILQACTRPTLAEVATYEYSRGGSSVTGPSIRLAEAMATEWGNIDCGVDILASDDKKSECIAYAWDLETNRYEQKRFTVKHWRDTKKGGYWITEERDIYELCANMGARRKRACILAVVPGDVTEAALDQCEQTLKTNIEITPEYIQGLVHAFEKFNVTKAMIEKLIQRRIDTLTPALAMRLKKIYASLKDDMSKPEDWFELVPDAGGEGEPHQPTKGNAGVKAAVRNSTRKKDDFTSPPAGNGGGSGSGPEPITDEALALLALDGCSDGAEGEIVLAQCKDQPFYSRVRDSFVQRFGA